jgi:diguanylate cyclase (GGDEF)-like protein
LLLLDVDLFKHFNDEYGHEMGDAVLRRVGETISQAFRTSDFTFRIGGDEFAVIMTDLNSSQRDVVTTKIANITKALRGEGGDVPAVTLSIGIAFTDETEVRSELFNSADAALYEVKRSGRNSYAFFSPAS